MAGQPSAGLSQRGIVTWLMSFMFVFQLMTHMRMWSTLREEEEAQEKDACFVPSPASAATSPRCMEVQLFRSWQRASPRWRDLEFGGEGGLESAVEDMTTPAPLAARNASALAVSPLSAIFAVTAPPTRPSTTLVSTTPASLLAADEVAQQALPAEKPWTPMTAWAQGLVDLQKGFESRMAALPSVRLKHEQESDRSTQFDQYAERIARSLESSEITSWGHEVQELQEHLEAKQAALPSQRRKADAAAPAAATTETRAPSLMDQVNAVHRELCEEPHRRNLTECVDFLATLAASEEAVADARRLERRTAARAAARSDAQEHAAELQASLTKIAEERDAWQRSFDEKVRGLYREFCASRGGIWCTTTPAPEAAQAPAAAAAASASEVAEPAARRSAERAALRRNISAEVRERAAALDAKLAKLADDRKAWERTLLEHYGLAPPAGNASPPTAAASTTSGAAVELWSDRPNMRWSSVKAWPSAKQLRGSGLTRVSRVDLERARWVGALPSVACVAVVPLGHSAKSQVKYVIDSFNRQTYEGPKRLVLVYHHEDEEAADVLKLYADGSYVKAVAARGPQADFPSSTAFRFGAWTVRDADVVAEWGFDESHAPQRLSLQVRALALASRPACLLTAPPAGQKEEPRLLTGSVVGEAAWMTHHWHPLLQEQRLIVEDAQAHNVVVLDAGLLAPAAATPLPASPRLEELRASMDGHFERLLALLENTTHPSSGGR